MTLDCSHLGVPLRKKWQWLPAAAASLLMQWLKKILEQQSLSSYLTSNGFIHLLWDSQIGRYHRHVSSYKRPHVPAKLLVKTWVVLHLCKAWPPLPTQKMPTCVYMLNGLVNLSEISFSKRMISVFFITISWVMFNFLTIFKRGYRIGQKYRKLTLAFKENLGS